MMKVVDLFCGCGGMSLGFSLAGHEVLAGLDNWDKAIAVYRENFNHPVIKADLKDIDSSVATIETFKPDMIVGGPPCQDFSSAGKRDEDNGRGDLTVCYAQIIAKVRPKWFVMENVSRIVKTQKLVDAKSIFREAGYGMTQYILDASLCGVPQARKRFVLIGKLGANDGFMTHFIEKRLSSKPMTIAEYMGDELDIKYYYRHPRSYLRRGIFSIDEPSPTIRGVNRPMPKGYPLHPGDAIQTLEGIRSLTTRERSRIQTFPADFKFSGNKTDMEQMIGNAVPVNLGKFVGNAIQEFIDVYEKEKHISAPAKRYSLPSDDWGKHNWIQGALFEPEALYYIKRRNMLIGSCRQGTKQWIQDSLYYNYPIEEIELEEHPELLRVGKLVVKHRKTIVGYYNIKEVKVVTKKDLKELGYPVKSSKRKADAKYLLYSLKPRTDEPQINQEHCKLILGKGIK